MLDEQSGQAMTSHTTGPVPLVYVGKRTLHLREGGSLCDVAPTLLSLMNLPQPLEMTGHSLVEFI
jgi:2,3-bisphosphoglycerate-independent phosphoglycerate mutase